MEKAILKDGIRRELNTAAFTENGAVSITDYGADPTGKADSTAAIAVESAFPVGSAP